MMQWMQRSMGVIAVPRDVRNLTCPLLSVSAPDDIKVVKFDKLFVTVTSAAPFHVPLTSEKLELKQIHSDFCCAMRSRRGDMDKVPFLLSAENVLIRSIDAFA